MSKKTNKLTTLDDHAPLQAARQRLAELEAKRDEARQRRQDLEGTLPPAAASVVATRAAALVSGADDGEPDAAVVASHNAAREEFAAAQEDEAVAIEAVKLATACVAERESEARAALKLSLQPQAEQVTQSVGLAVAGLLNALAEREELLRSATAAGIGSHEIDVLPDLASINLPTGVVRQRLHVWASTHRTSFPLPAEFDDAMERLSRALRLK